MSKAKHTSGRWDVEIIEDECELWITNNQNCIAKLSLFGTNCIMEQEANARLIAAAPDLLEACKMLIEETNAGTWDCLPIEKAKAAITKAEGENAGQD